MSITFLSIHTVKAQTLSMYEVGQNRYEIYLDIDKNFYGGSFQMYYDNEQYKLSNLSLNPVLEDLRLNLAYKKNSNGFLIGVSNINKNYFYTPRIKLFSFILEPKEYGKTDLSLTKIKLYNIDSKNNLILIPTINSNVYNLSNNKSILLKLSFSFLYFLLSFLIVLLFQSQYNRQDME